MHAYVTQLHHLLARMIGELLGAEADRAEYKLAHETCNFLVANLTATELYLKPFSKRRLSL
jgi:hypothetical protein